MTTKRPKLRWELSTSDYDIKTYQVFHENTPLGYVDVEYYDGRISNRVVTPNYDGTRPVDANSRKDANVYLWKTHLGQVAKVKKA